MRGRAVFEREKLLEPRNLCFAECLEVVAGFGTAENGGEGGEEDFVQRIQDVAPSEVRGALSSWTAWAKDWATFLTFRVPLSFLRTLTMCLGRAFGGEVLVVRGCWS